MIDFIIENKEIMLSGIGAAIVGGLFALFKKDTKSDTSVKQDVSQNVTVNINKDSSNNEATSKEILDKESISILFIDDQNFDYIRNLKKAGYNNVKKVTDVKKIDCAEIINAHVIFVDVNGVGLNLFSKEQGLGIAKAIKQKYGNSKKVYLYSAQHQALSLDFNMLDGVLSKNADPYEFINLIDNIRNSK